MYLAHFYGRAAAGPSFSDRVLRTFTGTLTTVISYNNLKPYLYSGTCIFEDPLRQIVVPAHTTVGVRTRDDVSGT